MRKKRVKHRGSFYIRTGDRGSEPGVFRVFYRIDVQDFWEFCFFPGNCLSEKTGRWRAEKHGGDLLLYWIV